ncbi:TIGR00296 family protein [Candidatus Woesearchaeota archaeon CG08_land_8_20_14_0_20_43_7]|nr:MAG: TIGR00296 family protein [Candidatus Woesearchaeota archaeon CG08_land_8_20_14_0_20_43_7]
MLTEEQGKRLIQLAKESIISSLLHDSIDVESYQDEFPDAHGVFVTLKKKGELRGCIGFPLPDYPLFEGVFKAARAAAFDDPRFPPLAKDELSDIDIEISVLSVPVTVKFKDPDDLLKKIKVGRDGLMIKYNFASGLLLPQVPVELGWDEKTFLDNLCLKAGLPKGSWKEKDVEIKSFQAQVFYQDKEDEYANL